MRLLAVDTATEACSAALRIGDEVRERFEIVPRGHADLLLPMVDALLAEGGVALCDLDAIAFGRGPGSFTGVRIGTSVVQGLAFAAALPVVPVSSLAALARQALRECGQGTVLAAIDARMDEVYWGVHRGDGDPSTALDGEMVCAPERVPTTAGGPPWHAIGSGWASYRERLAAALGRRPERCLPDRYPRARDVVDLALPVARDGGGVAPERALPVYLRDRVAQVPRRKEEADDKYI